jgi:hypothetical protein
MDFDMKRTHYGAQCKSNDPHELDMFDEEGDFGRLARWLLERERRIVVLPVLIIAFDWEISIQAKFSALSAQTLNQQ